MKLAAVIVDTRSNVDIKLAISKHASYLPQGFAIICHLSDRQYSHPFMILGIETTENKKVAKVAFPVKFQKDFVINSIDDYNRLLTCAYFWDELLIFDRVLIFQHDSALLRNGIEEFYEYDYVGAPFWFQPNIGGNGGLSLRNPKIMKQICEQYPYVEGAMGNEDVYFSNIMHDKKIGNLAPREVCEKFSVESLFKLGTLGFHAIDKYLTPEQCSGIKTQYNG